MFWVFTLGACAVAYLLTAWFATDLPVHFFHLLRRLGWRSSDSAFWDSVPEDTTSRQEFFDAVVVHGVLPPLLADLLMCRVCLSFHIAFWMAVAVWLADAAPLRFMAGCAFAWPFVGNMLAAWFGKLLKELH